MKRFFNITCKQATYLLSKKEEGRLTWIEKWRLSAHLGICSFCRLFEIQTNFITHNVAHQQVDASMADTKKQEIAEQLKQL